MLISFCPVICTSRPAESRTFYSRLFGFTVTHATEWYTGLGRPGRHHELALVDHGHPALPEALRTPMRAVRITLEVDDRAAEWERLATLGARRCPERGHLVVKDPNGVWIDVVPSN